MSRPELRVGPAAIYQHDHPPAVDVYAVHQQTMTVGQRVADRVAATVGSWPFIIIQSGLLVLWIVVNVYFLAMEHLRPGFLKAWDPYPFILLNLMLSFQAAYTGPVVMMSQNRHNEKDRLMAQHDFEINEKAEKEIEVIMQHLVHQDRLILDAIRRLEALQVTAPVREVAQKIDVVLHRMDENDRRILALMRRTAGADAQDTNPQG